MDDIRITHPPRTTKDPAIRLARLEEKLRHELLSEEERCELPTRSPASAASSAARLGRDGRATYAGATAYAIRPDKGHEQEESACT